MEEQEEEEAAVEEAAGGVAPGGDLYTKALPDTFQEPAVAPETAEENAYDFNEYDLKEYDAGGADRKAYDYGAYGEYGVPVPPDPTGSYHEEVVGPGVAAETDISESAVSIGGGGTLRHPLLTSPGAGRLLCRHARVVC